MSATRPNPRGPRPLTPLLLGALLLGLSLGCTTTTTGQRYDFFGEGTPTSHDPWSPKIATWQKREIEHRRSYRVAPNADGTSRSGLLSKKFALFLGGKKRSLAREITEFSQQEARRHYRADDPTDLEGDHWPTTRELFVNNGDDCDGLDLIAYNLLRESGFAEDKLYRLVVRRNRDGAFHMVTLWFEDRDDPWVLDATGAMSMKMRRYSGMPYGWTPVVIFNERLSYPVGERTDAGFSLAGE